MFHSESFALATKGRGTYEITRQVQQAAGGAGIDRGLCTVFVHHTSQPNGYDCDAVPRMLRQLETEHVERGWDDLGYNFVVDRCGNIYEGRSGAHDRPVEDQEVDASRVGRRG